MERFSIFEETTSNTHIDKVPDRLLPNSELEIRRVWNSLPVEQAKYFMLLDAYTLEDEFYVALRGAADEKIYGNGIIRVGDLIGATADEVMARTALTPAEMHKLTTVLSRMGLAFGMDVSHWRRYRETVAPDFRLRVPYQTKLPQETRSPLEI